MRIALPLILLALPAAAAETDVVIATDLGDVVATLETPDDAPEGGAPVVLLLHGFGGNRHEQRVAGTEDGVFSRTAAGLAAAGYASLRIDFRGSGESPGAYADTTFTGQTADAVAAIDWLLGSDAVDGERLAILGWSQGGLIGAHAAAARAEVTDAVVLWAPLAQPRATFRAMLGDAVEEALAAPPEQPFAFPLPWGGEMTLRAAFFHEAVTHSTAGALTAYPGPVRVIVALNDVVVGPQPASGELLLRYRDAVSDLQAFETDHSWSASEGPEVLDELMVPATVDWLDRHL